ncbi:MAG: phosphatidylglycerol lysyltransferase domain-containing protein [Caulobacterales bacterium]
MLPLLLRQGLSALAHDHGPLAFCASLALGALAIRSFAGAQRKVANQPSLADLARAENILARQPNAAAGLVRLGDKRLLFSECGDAFIMYARQGRSMIALFDPIGPRRQWTPLVLQFMAEAKARGCRPVFYQVSPDFLPVAIDTNVKALKLGEQAVLDLTNFSLAGKKWLNLRRAINRAERDGLVFEMLGPDDARTVFAELAAVSDAWLAEQNVPEKGFSLGVFKQEYLTAGPVAIIRLKGRIVAFASVHTVSSSGDAFIDLMRHVPGVHRGVMDLLFVRIMEYLRDQNFRSLNLGMAPLAGLSKHSQGAVWNRIGGRIFENGERFYNFRGVREFKSKFHPDWQPRYLAVAGPGFPIVSLVDVTVLIGGGWKSVLKK